MIPNKMYDFFKTIVDDICVKCMCNLFKVCVWETWYVEIMTHTCACVCLWTRWPVCGSFCYVVSRNPQRKKALDLHVFLDKNTTFYLLFTKSFKHNCTAYAPDHFNIDQLVWVILKMRILHSNITFGEHRVIFRDIWYLIYIILVIIDFLCTAV